MKYAGFRLPLFCLTALALLTAGTFAPAQEPGLIEEPPVPAPAAETPPPPVATPAPAPSVAPAPQPPPLVAPAPALAPQPTIAIPATPPPVAPLAVPPSSRTPMFESSDSEYQNVRVYIAGAQETQSVGDDFRLQVKVANRTGEEITVTKVRWELPRSIVAIRPTETESAGKVTWVQGADLAHPESLPNRSEQLFDLAMPAIHESWWNLPRNTRMMAFKPGEYPIKVRVEYVVGPNRRTSVAEETIRVRFDTTAWFYIWGGVLGSMIGVLFEFFYTTARGLERYAWPRNERGRLALGAVFRDAFVFLFRWLLGGTAKWLTGSLTAAIVLLFLYYYKDVHLPITIQINDFFGAVVVGLIAHRLGLWVYDTLFARAEKPPTAPGGGGTPTEPFHFPQQVVPALTYPQR